MLNKALKTIGAHSLFSVGDRVIVAVSGGADSVALLDILASLQPLRLNLIVAHLNHSLRGAESDGDEAFVRELAARYGLPCEAGRADVRELSRREKLSLEEAGRVARHAFLRRLAAQYRADAIALAHHADDQAETVLMRLLRGAGATGLAGIAPKTGDKLVRPLLGVTRREIEAYLRRRGLVYRTDSSNAETKFLRNRVRHELLPALATYNPSIRDRLVATAEALAADEALLEEITDAAFARHGEESDGAATLWLPGVRGEAAGLRLRLYRRAILLAKGDLARIGARHLRAIDQLIFSGRPSGSLALPDGARVARSYDRVSFTTSPGEAPAMGYEMVLEGPGTYPVPGGGKLLVEEAAPPASWGGIAARVAYFDAEAAPFPWLVRTFRGGDRIVPLGMSGSKKVKNVFIDAKVPRASRKRVPLLFSGERLIWICGLGNSAETRVTERTARVMRAEILDITP
ncbi:MAG: tRNA lysidine(34) synthetase TilS [Geobacteraceae bacterium]|nr:tRNA lysidine(34) synthetase TilS [Geobacteraceae bacterium]